MLPIGDVIPTRTPPVATIALIAASVLTVSVLRVAGVAVVTVNMVCLWLFGWTMEDRLGHLRFAGFYLFCAATAWMLSVPAQAIASGVAGVMGAYFALYPRSWMLVLVPVPGMLTEVPSVVFLALWLLFQIVLGWVVAPFGAFVVGGLLSFAIRRPERLRVDWWSR